MGINIRKRSGGWAGRARGANLRCYFRARRRRCGNVGIAPQHPREGERRDHGLSGGDTPRVDLIRINGPPTRRPLDGPGDGPTSDGHQSPTPPGVTPGVPRSREVHRDRGSDPDTPWRRPLRTANDAGRRLRSGASTKGGISRTAPLPLARHAERVPVHRRPGPATRGAGARRRGADGTAPLPTAMPAAVPGRGRPDARRGWDAGSVCVAYRAGGVEDARRSPSPAPPLRRAGWRVPSRRPHSVSPTGSRGPHQRPYPDPRGLALPDDDPGRRQPAGRGPGQGRQPADGAGARRPPPCPPPPVEKPSE